MREKAGDRLLRATHGLIPSALLAAAICLAAALGLFRPIDGLISDAITRLAAPLRDPGPRSVLLVEAPIETFISGPADWAPMVERLLALGAERVAFTSLPTLDPAALQRLRAHPRVDLAARVDVDPNSPERSRLRLPQELRGLEIPAAVVRGDSDLGIHRSMPYAVPVEGEALPTLEALVARRMGREVPAGGSFRIGFMDGAPRDFPRTTLRQVQAGELIEEAVRGRVALVGPVSTRFQATVVTPVTTDEVTVDALDYHGFALDSLLRGRTVATLPPAGEALLAALAGLVTFLVLQPLPFRRGVAVATLEAVALVALAVLLLPLAHFHLPVVAALLVIGTTTVAVFQHKTRRQSRTLGSLVTTTTLALANRWAPQAPREEQAFWAHLLGMIDQLLPLNRALLLERAGDTERLRPVAALRCALDDVAERRRDLRRPPYTEALAGNEDFEPAGFLKGVAEDERQVLLPLVADGQVLGYWAFGLARERLAARPTLHHAFRQVADELAELLLERRGDRRRLGRSPRLTQRLADQGDAVMQRLTLNLRAIDRHFTMTEEIFDGLRAPTIVYDLVGRTIAANRQMKVLLARLRLDAAQASAPALLETLCGMDGAGAREAIAGVAFEGHEFERTTHGSHGRHLLRATSLLAEPPSRAGRPACAGVHALVVEVIPLGAGEVSDPRGVDVWQAFDRAIARVAPLAECDAIDFALDGTRELPRVAAPGELFVEALVAVLQLLAGDAKCPSVVGIRFSESAGMVTIELHNEGYAMPPEALAAAMQGPGALPAGPLRQIRALRDTAFAGGRFSLEAELGRGFRVRIDMPAAG